MKLIYGRLNNGTCEYWEMNRYINVGEYAIVENLDGYDLVQVVGIVETTIDNSDLFTKGHQLKRMVEHVYDLEKRGKENE